MARPKLAKFCYIVMRNSDFTEGRGPMVIDEIFEEYPVAHAYVMERGGIFGSTQRLDQSLSKDGDWHYNGYQVIRRPILDKNYREDLVARERQAALDKLTDRERALLQL